MNNRGQGRHVEDFRTADAKTGGTEIKRFVLPYLILIASQLPLCLIYFKVLWSERPHYALLPISIIACGVVLYNRWPRKGEAMFFPSFKSDIMLLAGVAAGVVGTLLLSPWIGYLSFLLLLGSMLARTNDRHVFGTLLAGIAPLVVLLQPPVALDFDSSYGDIQLISTINETATSLASDILDLSKYPHNISASQMEFKNHTNDSVVFGNGLLSVFTLLIVTGMYIAWQRITLLRSLLLLLAACFWAMAFEALSLVFCAIMESSFERDFYNPGSLNRILQFVAMFGAAAMTMLSEKLIALLCGPVDIQAIDENISYQDMLCRFWNSAVAGVFSPVIDVNVKKEVAWAKRRSSDPSGATSSLLWGSAILLGALCIFQVTGLGIAMAKSGGSIFSDGEFALKKTFLPPSINDWSQTDFELSEPDVPNPHDCFNAVWTYTDSDGHKCQLEISQAYPCWHNDELRKRRFDWKRQLEPEALETQLGEQTVRYYAGHFSDVMANYRYSLNFQMDGFGDGYETPLMWKNPTNFFGRFFARLKNRTKPRIISNKSIEINLYLDTIGPSNPETQQKAEELFLRVIQQVHGSILDGTFKQETAPVSVKEADAE